MIAIAGHGREAQASGRYHLSVGRGEDGDSGADQARGQPGGLIVAEQGIFTALIEAGQQQVVLAHTQVSALGRAVHD